LIEVQKCFLAAKMFSRPMESSVLITWFSGGGSFGAVELIARRLETI